MFKIIEPIEKIGHDIFALDFKKANRLGVKFILNDYKTIMASSISISLNGDLLINKRHKDYPIIKEFYTILVDATTENLIKAYKMYDSMLPDCNSFEDAGRYPDDDTKGKIICKVLLKIELLRREQIMNRTQVLLNLLLH